MAEANQTPEEQLKSLQARADELQNQLASDEADPKSSDYIAAQKERDGIMLKIGALNTQQEMEEQALKAHQENEASLQRIWSGLNRGEDKITNKHHELLNKRFAEGKQKYPGGVVPAEEHVPFLQELQKSVKEEIAQMDKGDGGGGAKATGETADPDPADVGSGESTTPPDNDAAASAQLAKALPTSAEDLMDQYGKKQEVINIFTDEDTAANVWEETAKEWHDSGASASDTSYPRTSG